MMTSHFDGVGPSCPVCEDMGVVVRTDGATATAERCSCARGECTVCAPSDPGYIATLQCGDEVEVIADQSRAGLQAAELGLRARSLETGRKWYLVFRACRCQTLSRRIGAYCRAEIPASHGTARVRGYTEPLSESQRKAKMAIVDWLKAWTDGTRGLLLWGPPGTGKTHLLCSIARELTLGRGQDLRYAEAAQLVDAVQESGRRGKPLSPWAAVDILVLDDLGQSALTEQERSAIEDMLASRYRAGRTTIVATNLHPDGPAGDPLRMDGVLGPRLTSRLAAMCRWMEVGGMDRRREVRV